MSRKQADNMTHPSLYADELMEELIFNMVTVPSLNRKLPPIMVWGQPGVGKSDIVKQIGKKYNRPVIDIRLLLKDPTDMSGIPYYNPSSRRMDYAPPSELPPSHSEMEYLKGVTNELGVVASSVEPALVVPTGRELATLMEKVENPDRHSEITEHEKSQLLALVLQGDAIIFLDELSSAPPAVQAAALQLVLDRRVGTYVLPPTVSMVAAGNRSEDATVHFSMPAPLRNRFSHFTLECSYDAWETWAIDTGIHPAVIGFLKANQGKLNTFDPKNRHVYAFATPRTWAFVSEVLWALSDEQGRVRNDSGVRKRLQNQVQSIVGVGVGSEFMASFEVIGQLPDAMDILEGKVKTFDMQSLKNSAAYSLIVNLCYRMRETENRLKAEDAANGKPTGKFTDTMNQYGDNYLRFLMENLDYQEDFIVMGAIISMTQYDLSIKTCDALEELLDKHENILNMI